jgi:hypothetical protein
MNVVGNGNDRLLYGANDQPMTNCVFKENNFPNGFREGGSAIAFTNPVFDFDPSNDNLLSGCETNVENSTMITFVICPESDFQTKSVQKRMFIRTIWRAFLF